MSGTLELFTIAEAAEALHVPEGWLRKRVTAFAVPHTRLGKHVRFTAQHICDIVAQGEAGLLPDISPPSGLSRRARRGSARTL
jgi:excisionase family DNA binding protein